MSETTRVPGARHPRGPRGTGGDQAKLDPGVWGDNSWETVIGLVQEEVSGWRTGPEEGWRQEPGPAAGEVSACE